jgi:hypothetical protein
VKVLLIYLKLHSTVTHQLYIFSRHFFVMFLSYIIFGTSPAGELDCGPHHLTPTLASTSSPLEPLLYTTFRRFAEHFTQTFFPFYPPLYPYFTSHFNPHLTPTLLLLYPVLYHHFKNDFTPTSAKLLSHFTPTLPPLYPQHYPTLPHFIPNFTCASIICYCKNAYSVLQIRYFIRCGNLIFEHIDLILGSSGSPRPAL